MRGPIKPVLERHGLFHSRDMDEARAFLNTKQFEFCPVGPRPSTFDLRVNGVYLPNTYVGYVQYGSPAVMRTRAGRRDYWVSVPIQECLKVAIGTHAFECGPDQAVIASPTLDYVSQHQGSGARFNFRIAEDAVQRQLSALLGEPQRKAVVFTPYMSLSSGYGQMFARYVLMAIDDFENGESILHHPVTASQFEELMISRLLLSHPHNYTEALRGVAKPATPRDIRRARDVHRGKPMLSPYCERHCASVRRRWADTLQAFLRCSRSVTHALPARSAL